MRRHRPPVLVFYLGLVLLWLSFPGGAVADLQPLLEDGPVELWSTAIIPLLEMNDAGVHKNNGIVLTPNGTMAVVTTLGAAIYAFDVYTGAESWSYQPPPHITTSSSTPSMSRSHSSATVALKNDFLVYTVVDTVNMDDEPVSRVVALDMNGQELWVSDAVEGIAQGDPLISNDGDFVFLTHNVAGETQGIFSIVAAKDSDLGQPGTILYSGGTGVVGDAAVAFGPPGIYHNPSRGNYDPYDGGDDGDPGLSQGDKNNQDFVMWGQTPKPGDYTAKRIQDGHIYGFQFPRIFDATDAAAATAAFNNYNVTIFQLGRELRDFQVTTPPVMTNNGTSAYWGVSRSGFRGWSSKRFSRLRNAVVGFSRNNDFPGQPVFAAPALSHGDKVRPYLFGGTSGTEFVRLKYDLFDSVTVPTTSCVKARAVIDGDDRVVYYVEENGNLHQADFDSLVDRWSYSLVDTAVANKTTLVVGEMALTPAGDVLLVADTSGNVKALQVTTVQSNPSSPTENQTAISQAGANTTSDGERTMLRG